MDRRAVGPSPSTCIPQPRPLLACLHSNPCLHPFLPPQQPRREQAGFAGAGSGTLPAGAVRPPASLICNTSASSIKGQNVENQAPGPGAWPRAQLAGMLKVDQTSKCRIISS